MSRPPDVAAALAVLLDGEDAPSRAAELLQCLGGPGPLVASTGAWLRRVGGLSQGESARLEAAISLALQALEAAPPRPHTQADAVARGMASVMRRDVEEVWVLTVGPGMRPLHRHMVARGAPGMCAVSVPSVLRPAVLDGAAGFFVVHNHPSGDPEPSAEDKRFTARLKEASSRVGLMFHDHLVLAGKHWRSCLYRSAPREG